MLTLQVQHAFVNCATLASIVGMRSVLASDSRFSHSLFLGETSRSPFNLIFQWDEASINPQAKAG